ncbi:D-galactoside/L-rhamnose binding SUEL lectin domain [Macleaya cordata]|uniref:D-galactoside/L-rhamnose binding SUEL lectin domain n=1 Tax=Macleaya cordata TaxID=56857 RepID=A0A200QLZ5_MACCD|nr:D-galactoside/L-rhamnose binding SUEL lectin domain [Macleaya cordata]
MHAYHVPRSFLNGESNTLILFEEIGGSPTQVNFETVTIGTICGNAYEGSTLQLSCQGGRSISAIQFASFGDPKGSCGSFQKGSCDAANTVSAVQKACVGQESCTINVSEATLGTSQCGNNVTKRLAVQAVC